MKRLLCLALLLTPFVGHATVHHVPSVHPTIQAGINAASPDDTVLVACGTYYESDILMKRGIVLLSETGLADCAVIDAEGQGQVMICLDLDPTPTRVKGFTFTHGYTAEHGGGVDCRNSTVIFEDCAFTENEALIRGGGMHCLDSAAIVIRCLFSNNTAGWGGGLLCRLESRPRIRECGFRGNVATNNGGGLYFGGLPDMEGEVSGSTFLSNTAVLQGGGIAFNDSSPLVTECLIANNDAGAGGGVWCVNVQSRPVLRNCTISHNSGYLPGAVYCNAGSRISLENSIISFSSNGQAFHCADGSIATLSCCNIYGNDDGDWEGCIGSQFGVNGNIAEDPLFCDAEAGDFSLCADSPCAPEIDGECGLIGALGVGCQNCAPPASAPEAAAGVFHLNTGPNPFRGSTTFSFMLPSADRVLLEVFDVSGRRVTSLLDRTLEAGSHRVDFTPDARAGGVYFGRLRTTTFEARQTVILVE
jgi:hypothetical protein